MKVPRSILAWLALGLVGTLGLTVMLVTPSLLGRRRIARLTARTVLVAGGIRLEVDAGSVHLEQRLPRTCVIVANHTSYLDGVILAAALPPRFGFVIKKEMSRVPLAGALLRRIGSEFVERNDRHRSAMDARRVLKKASEGQALVFFPEGTFSKVPGELLRFHTGAFVTAVRAGCPVIPLAIHGARRAMGNEGLWITPGVVKVEVLQAVVARPDDPDAAVTLREDARRQIASRVTGSHVAPVLPTDFIKRA
jgi:1-acyl-sn-glycerol-3-phosphate acyltransferase